MALVMGITIPAGLEIIYNKTIKMYDISVFCNVGRNPRFFPRAKKIKLREITYLFALAQAWANLSDSVKEDWNFAGNILGWHGYNLWVQDKSYRIKNSIAGNADPSAYHQFKVGHLKVEAPASSAEIRQIHSHPFTWPCSFETCFKTNLTASGGSPSIKLRFHYLHYAEGKNIGVEEEINLPLISGWDKLKKWLSQISAIIGTWRLDLVLTDVVGDVWFDDVYVTYGGSIETDDPDCNDVTGFWYNYNVPAGVTFESVYPTGDAL